MNKENFLNDIDVIKFIKFIVEKWSNGLDFKLGIKKKGKTPSEYVPISSLKEASEKYCWQYSIKTELEIPEIYKIGIFLADSKNVLNFCKSKLLVNGQINSNHTELRDSSEIILRWGGVFKESNIVNDKEYDLRKSYQSVSQKWQEINLNNASFESNINFKSNSGFSKIYSLLLNDFIIYDSRVSVALAYLMELYFKENLPKILQIYMPSSRVADTTKRKVNDFFKSTNQQDSKHFYSNVKSSLLLSEALKLINSNGNSVELRELEASLFMIGYDIRNLG